MLPNLSGLMIGPSAKRSRDGSIAVITTYSLDGFSSLNTNGVMTFAMPQELNCSAFVSDLRQCCRVWFTSNFVHILNNPPDKMVVTGKKAVDTRASWMEWLGLTNEQKAQYAAKIDLSTDEGLRFVFSDTLKDAEWFKDMPGKGFYKACVQYVRFGNQGAAQGSPRAWMLDGFGLWAHLVPDIGLPIVILAMNILRELGLQPGMPEHFPHIIYKPPGGAALGTHHDQMSPMELLSNLEIHLATTDGSTLEWVKKHGCQMLAHLDGGKGENDGATYTIGPMTPAKLYVCLKAFSDGKLTDSDHEHWNSQPRGKINLNWENHIDEFNAILGKNHMDPIGKIPAAPGVADTYVNETGHLLLWPVGWPHGSFGDSGSKGDVQGSRITVTMPITIAGSTQHEIPQILDRLKHMGTLATSGGSAEEYQEAQDWLMDSDRKVRPWLRDSIPDQQWAAMPGPQKAKVTRFVKQYADGNSHAFPQVVCDFIRCQDASAILGGPVGPFQPISVKKETVNDYLAYLDRMVSTSNSGPSASMPAVEEDDEVCDDDDGPIPPVEEQGLPMLNSMLMERPRGWHKPPPVAVLNGDVRLVKVKQPWATHLVMGLKDCENRTWCLNPQTGFPAWVIVVSSKCKPKKADLNECSRRLLLDGHDLFAKKVTESDYDIRVMVGMIQIQGCYAPDSLPWATVWHNPPDFAWMVSDAWEFDNPIPLDKKDKFQTQISLSTCEEKGYGYKDKIEQEIALLEEEERYEKANAMLPLLVRLP